MKFAVGRSWAPVAFAIFVLAWGGNHFTPLLSLYENLGHHSLVAVNLLFATYVAGLAPGLLVAGPLSNRFGRRPLVATGLVFGIGASVVLSMGLNSELVLCIGRALAGVSVGIAMSVGSTWVRELTMRSRRSTADDSVGAKRSSLALTLGFGVGAGVSGVIAQWGADPTVVPYVVHVALGLIALGALSGVPETAPARQRIAPDPTTRTVRRIILQPRVLLIIAPVAPWVFAAAGIAYATMPQLVAPQIGSLAIAYAAGLTVATLGAAAVVQPFVARINAATKGKALIVGLSTMLIGVTLTLVNTILLSPIFAVLVAVVLGAAYGICLVAGLIEVQRLATPTTLPTVVGIYYSLSYTGFVLPVVLSSLAPAVGYVALLTALVVACLITLAVVILSTRWIGRRGGPTAQPLAQI